MSEISLMAVVYTLLLIGMGLAGISDLRTKRVPWQLQVFMYLLALTYGYLSGGLSGLASSFFTSTLFLLVCYWLYKTTRAMGGADVKFMVILSAWLGFWGVYIVIFLATTLAIIFTLIRYLTKGTLFKELKTTVMAFYIKVVYKVKGDTGLGQLPEDINALSPKNTIPFVTFLGGAVYIHQLTVYLTK